MDWEKLGKIIATADGGCNVCVRKLVEKTLESFPEMNRDEFKEGILSSRWLKENEVGEWFEGEQ